MKIPNPESAVIDADAEKSRDYLLSSTHPVGRLKAVFFMDCGVAILCRRAGVRTRRRRG